jgi:hypothetical protein
MPLIWGFLYNSSNQENTHMALAFKPAIKSKLFARIALIGPSGSGKTYTALSIATALGQKVAVIDTEHGAASKYADLFRFDVLELTSFDPRTYMEAIRSAQEAGYDTVVIDSLSHAWAGSGGVLEQVDQISRRNKSGNSFAAWWDVTPLQNQLVETMLGAKMHIVATIRSKMEYAQQYDDTTKKTRVVKLGLQPVQRDSIEYEFDIIGEMDMDNYLTISKTRCPQLKGQMIERPGAALAETIGAWLNSGDGERKANPTQFDQLESRIVDMNSLGQEVYGDSWPAKKAEQVLYVSKNRTGDVYQLTLEEINTMVKGIESRRDSAGLPPAQPANK